LRAPDSASLTSHLLRMQRAVLLMLLRVSRALIPRTAARSRSSVRHASAQPLGQRGLADGSEGITLFSSEAIQSGSDAPAVTVFWLHGLGDTADGWAGAFMPGGGIALPSDDYKVVLPTAETLPITLNGGMQMPAWFDIVGLDRGSQEDEAGMLKAAARLEALVALEDPSTQVVLGGFSQGGAVALTAGLRCKSPIAAVVGTSTWLPLGDSYPAALAETALERPVALHHGEADEVVRTSWGVASKERLAALGCRVSFDTYPGMAHSACPEEFEAISSFLRKEVK